MFGLTAATACTGDVARARLPPPSLAIEPRPEAGVCQTVAQPNLGLRVSLSPALRCLPRAQRHLYCEGSISPDRWR